MENIVKQGYPLSVDDLWECPDCGAVSSTIVRQCPTAGCGVEISGGIPVSESSMETVRQSVRAGTPVFLGRLAGSPVFYAVSGGKGVFQTEVATVGLIECDTPFSLAAEILAKSGIGKDIVHAMKLPADDEVVLAALAETAIDMTGMFSFHIAGLVRDGWAGLGRCDHCGQVMGGEDIEGDVRHLTMRVAPGDIMPMGECLLCGEGLVYPVGPVSDRKE